MCVIPQKLTKKVFSTPLLLTEGKAFDVPSVIGAVVSGITAIRGAAAVVDAPDFKGTSIADRADNLTVALGGSESETRQPPNSV